MSQSIEYVVALGGTLFETTEDLAAVYVNHEQMKNISATLNSTETNDYRKDEWTFDDGSIIHLWNAGRYAKQPWYFMAYSKTESDAIRYRRENPTPDTTNE